jgi:flagellar hook-associated protein 1 FlgK
MAAGLDIAMVAGKSSLITSQKQIAVISNNVSKANDPYYHRRTSSIDPNAMVLGDSGYIGTGVHIAQIVRQYDSALENSLRNAVSDNAYESTYYDQLSGVEDILAPGGDDPLNDVVQEFATTLQAIATDPEEIANRTALIGAAESVADRFNQNYDNLASLRDYIAENDSTGNGAISKALEDVKGLLDRIPDLNKKIKELEENEFRNQKANDLRDERDEIVSELAKYIDISITEESDGRYTIKCDGQTLINGTYTPQLQADYLEIQMTNTPPSAHYVPSIVLHSDNSVNITLTTGEVKGYLDAHEYIRGEMDDLYDYAQNFGDSLTDPGTYWEGAHAYVLGDTIRPVPSNGYVYEATTVAGNTGAAQPTWPTTVGGTVVDGGVTWTCVGEFSVLNAAHMEGYDLNGDAGGKLFSMSTSQPGSGDILSVAISDPKKIAASSVGDETAANPELEVEKGNGQNMLSIWSDMDDSTKANPTLDGESIISYANRYISDIAQDVSVAENKASTAENIMDMFQNAVFEVSAVNMDDEMTEMLEIQRTYQASAKLINTIDQMMGMVMNLF